MKNVLRCLPAVVLGVACQSSANNKPVKTTSTTIVNAKEAVPATRSTVRKEAVATYSTKVTDELNEWYFKVKLYETPETFKYVVKIEYEELRNTDTLSFPNFGIPPALQLKAGPSAYSCIIGFLDKEGIFREYKLVEAKGDRVKLTTLKHYTTSAYLVK